MKCAVCGKKFDGMVCPKCGLDYSQKYGKNSTFWREIEEPSAGTLRKQKPAEKTARRLPAWLVAAVCVVMVALGLWIGTGLGEPVQLREPWEANILRSDAVPYQCAEHWDWDDEAKVYPVFGSQYRREQIRTVTFLDTLAEAPGDAWDVSADGDDSVLAWVIPNGELFDLYIGADGGINGENACKDLFAGYANVERIDFGQGFHTGMAEDMSCMFLGCFVLKQLDLSCFDTADVQDMSYMFCYCSKLESLDLNGFDTADVRDMRSLFSWCESLGELHLSGFDTANVRNMREMFYYCKSLTELDLRGFDTANVQDLEDMFAECPAGSDWQGLLK